jgi:hypothetical protein
MLSKNLLTPGIELFQAVTSSNGIGPVIYHLAA